MRTLSRETKCAAIRAAFLAFACVFAFPLGPRAQADIVFSLDRDGDALKPLLETPGVERVQGSGRFGGPALRITPDAGQTVSVYVFAKPQPLPAPDQFRVECWARAPRGKCAVTFVLYAADDGAKRAAHPIIDLHDTGEWIYGACDVSLVEPGAPLAYNIAITASGGPAMVSSLQLHTSESAIHNSGFLDVEPVPAEVVGLTGSDLKRVLPSGWRREYTPDSAAEQADGAFRYEPSGDTPGLLVKKSGGVFRLAAPPVALQPDVTGFVARARTHAADSVPVTLIIRQFGTAGVVTENTWSSSNQKRDTAPSGTLGTPFIARNPDAVRVSLSLRFPREPGTYRLSSAGLHAMREPDDTVHIYADQVGYNRGDPVRFVVGTGVFPANGTGAFTLEAEDNKTITGPLRALGRAAGENDADWGAYYFDGLASDVPEGTYRLHVTVGNRTATFEPLVVANDRHARETGVLAYRFFFVQRCGCEVPGWHAPCHMDDGKLPDGSHYDVSGGWHNAGDYGKWTGDHAPVSAYGLVMAYQAFPGYYDKIDRNHNGRPDIVDEAVWGCDWLKKLINPQGRMYAACDSGPDYYGIPELDTDGIPGNADDRKIWTQDPPDLGALAVATWATLPRLGIEGDYLECAEKIWDAYRTRILAGGNPRHLFAAMELHRTTGNRQYRAEANRLVRNILALQTPDGWYKRAPQRPDKVKIIDEGTIPAALASYALRYPDSTQRPRIEKSLRRYFEWSFARADDPFGIIRNRLDGEPFYFIERKGLHVGNNSQYLSTAWAAYLASTLFADDAAFRDRLRIHAANHVHWVLGMNPLAICMFEGEGNSHRIWYHHRYCDIPGHERGAVPGTVPNGIIRRPDNTDRPWFDFRPMPLASYASNEPWLPHNAYYLLMLSASGADETP